MPKKILLMSNKKESHWCRVVSDALAPIGQVQVVSSRDGVKVCKHLNCDLVIIDALDVDDAVSLTRKIRTAIPTSKVIIATDSTTWRRAREAFLAGASDYVYKTLDEKTLQKQVKLVLRSKPPPVPEKNNLSGTPENSPGEVNNG